MWKISEIGFLAWPIVGIGRGKQKEYADGSALITFPDGSMAILESALAEASAARESGLVSIFAVCWLLSPRSSESKRKD